MNLFSLREPDDLPAFRSASGPPNAEAMPLWGAVTPPPGFDLDHNHTRLGAGEAVWLRAREAIQGWRMFDLPWVSIDPARPALEVGEAVVVLARQFPVGPLALWVRNVAKIAWVADDEQGPVRRFGLCYITTPWHVERGAERFQVTWDRESDEVRYDLNAYSRPAHWLARLGKPWVRRQQRRFARGSLEAMRRATA